MTRRASVVVAAAGVPGLVTAAHIAPGPWSSTSARPKSEKRPRRVLVGDVAYDEVAAVAGAITPVPGGVVPLTTALLLQNAVALAEARAAAATP